MLRALRSKKGFTLIELMIVVAIIGILAAVAIPNFLSMRYKAKTSEAKANLGAIRTCEEAYKIEEDAYKTCADHPAIATLGSSKQAWSTGNADFRAIGFTPTGDVYYSYSVAPNTAGISTTFKAYAQGDLDGDGTDGLYMITNVGLDIVNVNEGSF